MAVLALASAKGSPGVTTTALGLALRWHRPVILVEADVSASSSVLAGWLRGTVAHERGLVDLALDSALSDDVDKSFQSALIPLRGRPDDHPDEKTSAQLLPGLANAAQLGAVGNVWRPLGVLLRKLDALGTDVIIDLGRLGTAQGPAELIVAADLTVLVCRSDLPAIAAARAWTPLLGNDLERSGQGATSLRAVVVGPNRPYSPREITDALDVPVLGTVAWAPSEAATYSHGTQPTQRRWPRTQANTLEQSLAALHSQLHAALAERPSTVQESA